jgi:hypothetical protein
MLLICRKISNMNSNQKKSSEKKINADSVRNLEDFIRLKDKQNEVLINMLGYLKKQIAEQKDSEGLKK